MPNALKTLVFNKQASLTVIDTTSLARKGVQLHNLKNASAYAYAKAISVMAFMSACLKEERGEISFDIRAEGALGGFCASGNKSLSIRGYVENTDVDGAWDEETEKNALKNGSLTVIRDDGYSRPFVGTCAFENVGIDSAFETYYAVSEQLPTRIKTVVKKDENGDMVAGIAVLQLLPFADEDTQRRVNELNLEGLVVDLLQDGVTASVKAYFGDTDTQTFDVEYRCNCSRDYLLGVLVSLGEAQMREIIRLDGELRVHCHYCNTDYVFTDEDADALFPRTKKTD